jgi:sirohydrochlorin ferrochelatase
MLFSDATLLLIGHGSTVNGDSGATVFQHAAELRRRGLFADVREAFFKIEPRIGPALAVIRTPRIFVVPLFVSEGYFTQQAIPCELGLPAAPGGRTSPRTPFDLGDRQLFYCNPVGTHPAMTRIILARAREAMGRNFDNTAEAPPHESPFGVPALAGPPEGLQRSTDRLKPGLQAACPSGSGGQGENSPNRSSRFEPLSRTGVRPAPGASGETDVGCGSSMDMGAFHIAAPGDGRTPVPEEGARRACEAMANSRIAHHASLRSAALVIAGHGTELNAGSRKSVERQVELIAAQQIFAEVHPAFLEETPRIAEIPGFVSAPDVVVVPFFMSDGLHVSEDIPVLLGEDRVVVRARLAADEWPWRNPTERGGKQIWYARGVGSEPGIAGVILDRVCECGMRREA